MPNASVLNRFHIECVNGGATEVPVTDHHAFGQLLREFVEPFVVGHNIYQPDLESILCCLGIVHQAELQSGIEVVASVGNAPLEPGQILRVVDDSGLGSDHVFRIIKGPPLPSGKLPGSLVNPSPMHAGIVFGIVKKGSEPGEE